MDMRGSVHAGAGERKRREPSLASQCPRVGSLQAIWAAAEAQRASAILSAGPVVRVACRYLFVESVGAGSSCFNRRRLSISFFSTSRFVTTNSTRRFFAQLSSFVLGTRGLVLP